MSKAKKLNLGIVINPNTLPTTQTEFSNIAEDAIRVARETLKQIR